jgi:hypothetical protein
MTVIPGVAVASPDAILEAGSLGVYAPRCYHARLLENPAQMAGRAEVFVSVAWEGLETALQEADECRLVVAAVPFASLNAVKGARPMPQEFVGGVENVLDCLQASFGNQI